MRRGGSIKKIKTIIVEEDVWSELIIAKYRLRKRSLNEVIKELLRHYYEAERK
jgi:predicted CopG family antitoxin